MIVANAETFASAPCTTTDPELFFPDGQPKERAAKALCDDCPVLAACRRYARDVDHRYGYRGVWAGMTSNERRREDLETGNRRVRLDGRRGGEAATDPGLCPACQRYLSAQSLNRHVLHGCGRPRRGGRRLAKASEFEALVSTLKEK